MVYTKSFKIIIVFLSLLVGISGCSYSFTGASVPPHLKTISIPIFVDRSGSGEPTLRDNFTDKLIQKFLDDNSLQVTDNTRSDAVLKGTVISLTDAPAIVSGGEDVSTRRITITVRVVYKDMVKRKTVFDRRFSDYGDYSTEEDIVSGREAAIEEAVDKITEDILIAVVSNW